MNNYDPEKTSMAIRQSGGRSLDPLVMIHEDVQECFRQVGKNNTRQNNDAQTLYALDNEVKNVRAEVEATGKRLETLQGRLWGILLLFITETIGVAAAWIFG